MGSSGKKGHGGSGPFSYVRSGDILFGLAWREKIKRTGKKPLVQVHFYWKRVFALFFILGIMAWVSGSAVLYFYFKERRDYEEVSYFKMLVLPFRLDEHRTEMGEFFIKKGTKEIEAGDFSSGFHHLRIGLARSPANAEARLLLARIFHSSGFGDNRLAIEALMGGLKFADQNPSFLDLEYLRVLFSVLSLDEQDEQRIELAEELMDQIADPRTKALLVLQAAQAEGELGRYQAAQERLLRNRLQNSPHGYILMANSFWRAGYLRRAILTYEQGIEKFPKEQQLVYTLLSLLEEEELWEELLSYADFRRLVEPGEVKTWTSRLGALEGLGRSDEVMPAATEILERFPTAEAGFEVMRVAVKNKRADVAELAMARMRDEGVFVEPHAALMGLAFLRGGHPQTTLDFLEDMDEEGVLIGANREMGIRALAHRMLGNEEAALTQFQRFLDSERLNARAYASMADFFAEEGFTNSAYRILREGLRRFPANREILQRILLDHEKDNASGGAFVEHARTLVSGRIPPVDVLREIRAELVSDRYLFFSRAGRIGEPNRVSHRGRRMARFKYRSDHVAGPQLEPVELR